MEKCVKTNKIEWIWEDGYKIMLGLRRVATGSVVQRLSKLAIVSLNRTFGTHAELRHILKNWRRKHHTRKQHGRLASKAWTNKHHQNPISNSHISDPSINFLRSTIIYLPRNQMPIIPNHWWTLVSLPRTLSSCPPSSLATCFFLSFLQFY